jgi:hypothetical protein
MPIIHGRQAHIHVLLGIERYKLLERIADQQPPPNDRVSALIRQWVYDRLAQELPNLYACAKSDDESDG